MTKCWYCDVAAVNMSSGTMVVEVDWIIFCCWTTVSEDHVWRTWKQSYKLSIDIQSQLIPFWSRKIWYQMRKKNVEVIHLLTDLRTIKFTFVYDVRRPFQIYSNKFPTWPVADLINWLKSYTCIPERWYVFHIESIMLVYLFGI
jgi:hypothetical protein